MSELNYLCLTLILLMLYCDSFGQTTTNPEVDRCKKHWIRQDSLNNIKLDYFKKYILDPSTISDDIPSGNIEFLQAIYNYLKLSQREKALTPIDEKPIKPIFTLVEGQTGISRFPFYECAKTAESKYVLCSEVGYENQLYHNYDIHKLTDNHTTTLVPNPKGFEEIKGDKHTNVYTSTGMYVDTLIQLSAYFEDSGCPEYYHYQLKNQHSPKAIFATEYDLALEYEKHEKIESQIKNQYASGCYDCSYGYEPETVYARLKGIEQVYLSYTDLFSLSAFYNYPARAIKMKLDDGTIVSLWQESVDLFGCSCL